MVIVVRRVLLGVAAVTVTAAAAWALWPRPIAVETASVVRRPIEISVEDEGLSRIKDVFTVSSPIAGRLMRPVLRAGDDVVADKTVVASIRPSDPALLDIRARAVAEATISGAQSAVDQALAQQKQAQAQLDFAKDDLNRSEALAEKGVIPEQTYQRAVLALSVAQSQLDSAKAALVVRQHDVETARAALIEAGRSSDPDGCCVDIHAPVSGKVLAVVADSEQVVGPGAPILRVGDPADLEIAVDLLSRDAVTVQPGDSATIEGWGGAPLKAAVTRIDPAATTKVSALGIEEQRVTVVLKLLDPAASGGRLGHNFRVIVRIIVWRGQNLLTVPLGALFRQGNDWAVFELEDGRAHVQQVMLGRQNTDYAEVVSGLEPGATTILHPSDRVTEGTAVTPHD